ncbi:MAG: type IV pilus modification protein PilV [Halieaceae bacterium]|nr:type IV pilus modification protein PilV [Halieaceae bacterium]
MMRYRGFTLIEVLVTLFILALGLIGFLQMDIYVSQKARGTFFSSTAGLITTEFSERIYANRIGLIEGYYDNLNTVLWDADSSEVPECIDQTCNPQQLAEYDQWMWLQAIKSQLPWGDAELSQRASLSGDGSKGELTLAVKWLEVGAPANEVASFSMNLNLLLPGIAL